MKPIWEQENRSPTIAEFGKFTQTDRNAWWRLSSGDHENLFDEATDRIAELEAQINRIAKNIHYPECWDTGAYPTLADAVCEITGCDPDQCTHPQDIPITSTKLEAQNKRLLEALKHAALIISWNDVIPDDIKEAIAEVEEN